MEKISLGINNNKKALKVQSQIFNLKCPSKLRSPIKLTCIEVSLLLSSKNCCRVTTSLPGEPVLTLWCARLSVSGILCWSTGLDLVCLFKYWIGLLPLLDQASRSWSKLNSPLLWLCGLLWVLTAPAFRVNGVLRVQ